LRTSSSAPERRGAGLAARVIGVDLEIDKREVEVEEECLKLLALYQPVATDLRFIVTALKINNDLERIGDLAANIADRAESLATAPPITAPFDYQAMAESATDMLRKSVDALVNLDTALAREVLLSDDAVDALNRTTYEKVCSAARRTPENIDPLLRIMTVSHNLERIADHATNIAEDVIYMVEGKIVRHGRGDGKTRVIPDA
jgi:phosphate transport system protein